LGVFVRGERMTDRLVIRCWEPVQARKAMDGPLWRALKAHLMVGRRMVLELRAEKQSSPQQRKYHAMIGEIAKQVGGDLANAEDAKRILVSAFRIDTRTELADEWAEFGDLRMGRGLRGGVVLLGPQARDFKRGLASAFVEWLYAFGAEAGVVFADDVDPATGEILSRTRPEQAVAA